MVNVKSNELTPKQDKLARNYAKTGNKTLAGKLAGYAPKSAHSTAHDTLKIPKVAKAVALHRKRIAERLDISREKLRNDSAHDAEQASLGGDYSGANNARTFIAKVQGYLVERSLNVNVDVSAEHLAALQDLLRARNADGVHSRISRIMENGDGDKDK